MLLKNALNPWVIKLDLEYTAFLYADHVEKNMTVTLVHLILVLKMSVVKHDEICNAPEGFSKPVIIFCFLVRALAKCDDLVLVLTGTFIKSSS